MALTELTQPLASLDHIHHCAYRCRDAEQTRWFWEDVLGFELKLGLVFDTDPATGLPFEYMHLFFQMGDGNFIAFFDAPDDANETLMAPQGGYDRHLAFECAGVEELKRWQDHINGKGIACPDPIDHEFVQSIYMYDPNGLQVEITTKSADYDLIIARESSEVRSTLQAWTRRTRDKKLQVFGAGRIDMRAELCRENLSRIVNDMMQAGERQE